MDDGVTASQQLQPFLGDLPNDADGQSRPGKGLPHDHFPGQPQLQTHFPNLILEEVAQRLNQLQLHVFGKAAHVMMSLDSGRVPVVRGFTFDDIRIQGSLGQKLGVAQLRGDFLKNADEFLADGLALGFRVGDSFQPGQEPLGGIDVH